MATFPHLILPSLPILALAALPTSSPAAPNEATRERLDFNAEWRFHRGDIGDANPLGQGTNLEK